MAKQRKDEGPEEPRKDASGRELFPWEVDPQAQADQPDTEQEKESGDTGGSPAASGEGNQ